MNYKIFRNHQESFHIIIMTRKESQGIYPIAMTPDYS